MNIHLFRHGQIDGPAALYGKTDVALSADGLLALRRATQDLAPPEAIVSSPLRRCHQFALSQSNTFKCPLHVQAELREMDFGQWDGVPYSEHNPAWPAMTAFWQNPAEVTAPDGEPLEHMHQRVCNAWLNITALPQQNIWCFAHGGVIRLLIAHLLGLDWRNAQLYSNLNIGYASRTLISVQQTEAQQMIRIQAVGIPSPNH